MPDKDPARIRRTLTKLADAHTRDQTAIDAQLERLYAALPPLERAQADARADVTLTLALAR
jgi:hypothetical protein